MSPPRRSVRRLVGRRGRSPLPTIDRLDEAVVDAFEPYTGPGEQGFLIDFLGGRTRVSMLRGYEQFDGAVLGVPKREEPVLHEHDEWLGALTSVLEARHRGELVAVELGAGWGPWLVSCALAAKATGRIDSTRLIGVEATVSHHGMMVTHFRDNGLDPTSHSLLLGAVSDVRGVVRFPRLPDPAADWGATELTLRDGRLADRLGRTFDEFDVVPSVPIADLLGDVPFVDLLHVDIQGAEETAIPAALPTLDERVRRVVIGTHGPTIDRAIAVALANHRWVAEAWRPSGLAPEGALVRDGVQVWRNDRAGGPTRPICAFTRSESG